MSKDNMTLGELAKEYPDKTYNELTIIQEDLRLKKEAGACITAGMKRDKEAMEEMKKDKDIKNEYDYHRYWKDMYEKEHKLRQEAQQRIKELQIRLAEALEVDEAHQKQMGRLQVRLTEVEEDNQKLAHQVEDLKLNHFRKAGL
jgi:organic radical activating enzyme